VKEDAQAAQDYQDQLDDQATLEDSALPDCQEDQVMMVWLALRDKMDLQDGRECPELPAYQDRMDETVNQAARAYLDQVDSLEHPALPAALVPQAPPP
jgi:hypothetical protein